MKAIIAHRYGPASDFALEDHPLPCPAAGQVRIRIAAAAISYVDLLTAAGQYQTRPALPFTPGSEFSGTVDAVGPGASGFSPGDRVCGAVPDGAWAEFICLPGENIMAAPDTLSIAQAAACQVPYRTAQLGLRHNGALQPGETLFVTGAAGSVGLAAVQIGKLIGARVIAGASSAKKREAVLAAGADEAVDTSVDDWPKAFKANMAGRGVGVVFDTVGGPPAEALLRTLAWGGRYLIVGFAGGAIPAFSANWLLLKGASLRGVNVGQFARQEPQTARRLSDQLAVWLREGHLIPQIAQTFPLHEFVAAANLASDRQTVGRVVLTMEPTPPS